MSFKYKVFIFLRKVFVIIIVLSFFVNIFSNLPFNKIMANYTKDEIEEIILNEGYNDEVSQIYEMESERTPSSKVYKNSDGSYELIEYNNIIHEKTDDGYKEIDSTFKEETNEYSSSSIEYKVKLPKKIHDNKKIKLQYQSSKVEITYNGINKVEGINIIKQKQSLVSLEHLEGNIIYKNIYNNVDLECITSSTSVKENIILNKYIKDFSFSYTMTLTNLSLKQYGNYIFLMDGEGNIIYQIDPYYMLDSSNNISHAIEMIVTNTKNNEYLITIIPNNDWLGQAKYPVIIDPTINYTTLTTNNKVSYRSFLKNTNGSTDENNATYFDITKYIEELADGTRTDLSKYYIAKLDISDLPTNVLYTQAQFKVYSYQMNPTTHPIKLSMIDTTTSFTEINGKTSYSRTYVDTITHETVNIYKFNILNVLNLKLGLDEIIFELSPENFTSNTMAYLYNNSTNYRPCFMFRYIDVAGFKDYYTYHSVSLGSAGMTYINDYVGNMILEVNDYQSSTEKSSFNISHYYNSISTNVNIGYGNGWRLNYCDIIKSLATTGITNEHYSHIDGAGSTSYYWFSSVLDEDVSGSGIYINEDGYDSRIEINPSLAAKYKRIVDGDYEYTYNSSGELIKIVNTKKADAEYVEIEYITLTSDLRVISKIVDASNNIAVFNYTNDLLTDITIKKAEYSEEDDTLLKDELGNIIYTNSEYITYEYDENKNLIKINKRYQNSTEIINFASYNYNNDSKLVNAFSNQELTGGKVGQVHFTYDTSLEKVINYKVYSSTTTTANTLIDEVNITFANRTTTYTNYFGETEKYLFDAYGHTINVLDNDGNAVFYKYETDNENNYLNNKILETSSLTYTKYNIINNHSFEALTSSLVPYWSVNGTNKVSLDESNRVFGLTCLKIKNDDSTITPSVSQTVALLGGTTYTISCFIKTTELSGYESGGGFIDVSTDDPNADITKQTTYQTPSDEYTEYVTEFTLDGDSVEPYYVTINLSTSYGTTSYFDNINFVNGINDCRYNMLVDSSFENSLSSTTVWNNSTISQKALSDIFGNYECMVGGSTTMSQVVDTPVETGDTLFFGGYINTNGSKAKIRIRFYNIETDSYLGNYVIEFNDSVNDYQFLMESIDVLLLSDAHQIIFEVVNESTKPIFVDNLFLQRGGYKTSYTYNELGKPTQIIKAGKIIEITRNSINNRDIESIRYDNITLSTNETITDEYYKTELSVSVEGIVDNVKVTNYDYKEESKSETIVGDPTSAHYITTTTYKRNSQYLYQHIDEYANITTYDYDYITDLLTKVTNAKGIATTYEYDEALRLSSVTTKDQTVEYSYDGLGRLSKVQTNSLAYYFGYNEYNDIETIKVGTDLNNSKLIVSYEYLMYNNNKYTGIVSKIIYGDTSHIRYEYDNEFRITKVYENIPTNGESLVESCTYNHNSDISVYKDYKTDITYYNNYDIKGRLIEQIDSNGNTIKYTYDDKDNISIISATIDNELRSTYYNYDENGNLTSISDSSSTTSFYTQSDPFGRIKEKQFYIWFNSTIRQNYTYYQLEIKGEESTSNTTIYETSRISTEVINIEDITYTYEYVYDTLGNITVKTVETKNQGTVTNKKRYRYSYDDYNRLVREIVTNVSVVGNAEVVFLDVTYTYDNYNNLISITRDEKMLEYASLPSFVTYQYNDEYDKTKLTSYTIDGTTYNISYNDSGMPTTSGNYEYCFENDKLISIKENNIIKYKFTYDASGKRISKETYNNTTNTYDRIDYIYLNDQLIKEKHSDKTIEYLYDESNVAGFKVKTSSTEEVYYYIKNIQQDIEKIVTGAGVEVVSYTYDAYGKVVNIKGILKDTIGKLNPYRYRSYYYDDETGWFWLSSRYYSPELCRFISPDDVEYLDSESVNGLNLYCYCANDPINHVDPSGHAWYHWAIGAGIIVACAALTVITAGGFAAAGAAFASVVTTTMAPTALSAVFAGATIGAAAIGAAGAVIGGKIDENGFSWDNDWSWENSSKGFMIGSIAGAVVGGAWGGTHYALQSAGKMAVRVNTSSLKFRPDNPLSDDGISYWTKTLSQNNFKGYNSLPNQFGDITHIDVFKGTNFISNGHHRVHVLLKYGVKYINVFYV